MHAGLPTDSFIGRGRTYAAASMRRTREDTRGAPKRVTYSLT